MTQFCMRLHHCLVAAGQYCAYAMRVTKQKKCQQHQGDVQKHSAAESKSAQFHLLSAKSDAFLMLWTDPIALSIVLHRLRHSFWPN